MFYMNGRGSQSDFAAPWLPRMALKGWEVKVAPAVNYMDLVKAGALVSDPRERLAMGALGLAGEAGEVAELVKKHLYHGKELDLNALLEELGDTMWYLTLLLSETSCTLKGAAFHNIWKLHQRYPTKYPDPVTEVVVEI